MASSLRSLGFKVLTGENLGQKEMKKIIREFGQQIKSSGVGLFYYAGHGIQSNGRNYLIPIGAEIAKEQDIDLEAVDAGYALAEMEAAQNRMNILILDACRNNPFGRSYRSASRGLAQVAAPAGTFIAYATAPGSIAADGDGSNSLYTQELVRQMKMPGAKLEDVFKAVLSNVKQASGSKQVPWTASSVEGDFYFAQQVDEGVLPPANLPEKPKNKDFNIEDLDAAAKKEESVKNAWEKTLTAMKKAYNDVLQYEKRDVSSELKARAWNRFVATYAEDNPYSTDDNRLLGKAKTQYAYWSTVKPVSKPPSSQPAGTDLPSISNSIGMQFVLVQPGTFQMGSDDGESDEKPVHAATISKPYYIGKYEVTQAQWQAIMGSNPSHFKGDTRPVEQVSWNDAQDFIHKLNEKESTNSYRLPTEAEWEFAARGGIQSRGFKFAGSFNVGDVAVYGANSGYETKPVGSKSANELGIFDLSGNVWEWCQDWYGNYESGQFANPTGPASSQRRVLRGGSWLNTDHFCRSAYRIGGIPDLRDYYYGLGFRLVQDSR
jgi:formylglycine-generating enzyme required for sulfatase activity